MLRLAVTGGVATGKSTVLAAIGAQGIPTLDLDALCRELVEPGRPELEAIEREFGAEYVAGGRLDRARLRRLIGRDAGARRKLEAILHPAVMALMEERLNELAAAGHPAAAVEVPLLYEVGYAQRFDAVIVAACPPELALERAVARGGLSREEARELAAAQLPLAQKVAAADYVIDTSGGAEAVAAAVERLLHKLGLGTAE